MYCRIPLLLTLMAFLLVETHADFLDASFVGGAMSMPLDLELVQKAKDAGVITRDNPLYDTVSGPSRNLGTPTPEKLGRGVADETSSDTIGTTYDTTDEADLQGPKDTDTQVRDSSETKLKKGSKATAVGINVTGTWSLDLQDKTLKHLSLDLIQSKEAIMGSGSGTMESDDGTQKATVSGSLDGKRLSLAMMPMGSLDLYKLDLSLDIETPGRYTAYSSTGVSWSGEVSGTAPRGISSSTAYN